MILSAKGDVVVTWFFGAYRSILYQFTAIV